MPGPFLGQAPIGAAWNVVNGLILERRVKKEKKKGRRQEAEAAVLSVGLTDFPSVLISVFFRIY